MITMIVIFAPKTFLIAYAVCLRKGKKWVDASFLPLNAATADDLLRKGGGGAQKIDHRQNYSLYTEVAAITLNLIPIRYFAQAKLTFKASLQLGITLKKLLELFYVYV